MKRIWEKPMTSWRSRFLALAVLAGSVLPAFAQNAIQSINSSQQAGSEVIRIEMTEPLAAIPAGFTVQAPPRIAIDLPGVTNGLGKSSVEINRRKEPLEAYPVDSMTMVGSVMRNGQQFALLRVDNLLYQVKTGDYLGQNYGKITKISETDVAYREIVQDAAGEWIERPATLQLQERMAGAQGGAR